MHMGSCIARIRISYISNFVHMIYTHFFYNTGAQHAAKRTYIYLVPPHTPALALWAVVQPIHDSLLPFTAALPYIAPPADDSLISGAFPRQYINIQLHAAL